MNFDQYSEDMKSLLNAYHESRTVAGPKSLAAAKKLLRGAKKTGDDNLIGYGYYAVADIYSMWGIDNHSMSRHLLKALEYLQTTEDFELLGRVYNLLGNNALTRGDRMLALDYYLEALSYAEKGGSGLAGGLIRCNMGSIYMEIGDYERAVSYFSAGMRVVSRFKKDPRYFWNMEVLCNKLGISLLHLKKQGRAEKILERAKELYQKDPYRIEFPCHFVIMTLSLHLAMEKGDSKEENRIIKEIMTIFDGYVISTDSMEDMCDFARLLLAMERREELGIVIGKIWEYVEEIQITVQKINVTELRVAYLQMIGDEEEKNRTLDYLYRLYIQYRKDQMESNRFSLSMRQKMEELRKRHAKMQEENERLSLQATIDELTGLPNRYDLNDYAEEAFIRAAENKTPLGVEILDIDYFKQYNDTYGHQAGDECLRAVASRIKKLCEEHPRVYAARYGGDEFVVIYEDYSDQAVLKMAEDLRDSIRELSNLAEGDEKKAVISISQGIRNSVPLSENKLWDYMYAADNALYDIKKKNKGNVEMIQRAEISEKSLQDAKKLLDEKDE